MPSFKFITQYSLWRWQYFHISHKNHLERHHLENQYWKRDVTLIFRCFRKIAKGHSKLRHIRPSVRLYICPLGTTHLPLEEFSRNLIFEDLPKFCRKFQVWLKSDKNKGYLFVCLLVSMGVRGKPRMYLNLAGFLYRPLWTFQLGYQMPPRLPLRPAL
jgi:hypothetical protein